MKGSTTKYAVKNSSKPKWRYRVYVGKDAAGKNIYEGAAGFAKESEAAEAMRKHLASVEKRRGEAPREDPPLGEWVTRWLETYAPQQCAPKTLERYGGLVKYLTESPAEEVQAMAKTPLSKLRRSVLKNGFFAMLRVKGTRREHISARSVRHVAGVVSVALAEAVEQELIQSNPMYRLKLPNAERRNARSLTPAEIQALRGACRGDWTFPLIELALATGARRGELLALTWADVDWISGAVTISKSLEQTRAGLRIKEPKGKKTRSFALPRTAVAALQFRRDEQAEHAKTFGKDFRKDLNLIFSEPNGDYLTPDLVSQIIVRRMKKAGINGSIHMLRHSHASVLLSAGVPLPAVSARLGHADTNVTARVYSHALPDDDRRGADTWDKLIGGPVQ